MSAQAKPGSLLDRLVRYADLRPCTKAFIDTRTPGSDRKENFTIIGPGVAENPEQHVHIRIPHGFNIGGARQPPGCTNSQHSHQTAEVFIIQHGQFRFKTGEFGTAGHVDLGPGDVISIPIHAFRGFDTLGAQESFMFSVLGGDDPGHVLWAPYVFEAARKHGLVLLKSGRLIDTGAGETIPQDETPMPPTTEADVANLKVYDTAAITACTIKRNQMSPAPAGPYAHLTGVEECPVVGPANPAEKMPAGSMAWQHGFQVRALRLALGAVIPWHRRLEEEVLLIHSGTLEFDSPNGTFTLAPGDTFTVPIGMLRRYRCSVNTPAEIYVVRGGDAPSPPLFE